jgi:hypothetical protein
MLHVSLSASKIGAPLALAAVLACVTPAGAKIATNGTSLNQLSADPITQNGIPADARKTAGSPLGDLNGVAVETVIIPEAALR